MCRVGFQPYTNPTLTQSERLVIKTATAGCSFVRVSSATVNASSACVAAAFVEMWVQSPRCWFRARREREKVGSEDLSCCFGTSLSLSLSGRSRCRVCIVRDGFSVYEKPLCPPKSVFVHRLKKPYTTIHTIHFIEKVSKIRSKRIKTASIT